MRRFGILLLVLSSCAEITEPPVISYKYQKQAVREMKDGAWILAENHLKLALKYDPTSHAIWNNLAIVEYRLGHCRRSIGYFKKAESLKHDSRILNNEIKVLLSKRPCLD